jgi:hypothetical protein
MADYFTPFIKTIIDGKDKMRDFNTTEYLEVKTAQEVTHVLLDTSGEKTEDISSVQNLTRILIYTTGTVTVKFEINDGVLPAYDISIEVGGGLFSWPLNSTFASYIKKIKVSTTSITEISVSIKAYGT